MRSAPTDAEHRLWQILRVKRLVGFRFRRPLPIDHYIADFVCLNQRLIVEADGSHHGKEPHGTSHSYLKAQDFRILRFWKYDIFNNEEGLLQCIADALASLLSNPSPAEGRGG
ncbi:endonuclease domain-containing protein [Sphingosinicella rhizophila]|uniref:endonuclease domain-containing protein n=1 Tax=Sphingosinicella rhizophila TaxID=3050082 RepID=UPI0039658A97